MACVPVELRAVAADTAPVVARIERGDTVQVRQRDLHVVEPGRVVIRHHYEHSWDYDMEGGRMSREDTLRFAAGDTVYLLNYHQLGWWAWWHRGRESIGHEFWVNPEDADFGGASSSSDSSSATAVALSHPRTVDWWLVEPRAGLAGWWRVDSLYSLLPMGTELGPGRCSTQ